MVDLPFEMTGPDSWCSMFLNTGNYETAVLFVKLSIEVLTVQSVGLSLAYLPACFAYVSNILHDL